MHDVIRDVEGKKKKRKKEKEKERHLRQRKNENESCLRVIRTHDTLYVHVNQHGRRQYF